MEAVKNGSAGTRTGSITIWFSLSGDRLTLKPVSHAVYSGYQPSRGTYQQVGEGDIAFTCEWNSRETGYSASVVGGSPLPEVRQAELWQLLRQQHGWAYALLEPMSRGGFDIPVAVVPVSEYISEKRKAARFAAFERKFGIEIPDGAWKSPKAGIRLRPEPADAEFLTRVPVSKEWSGSMVDIDTKTFVFVSNGDGVSTPVEVDPWVEHGSNYAGSAPTDRRDGGPVVYPKGYKYAIWMVTGAYTRDHYSYGVTIEVREI